MIEAWWRSIYLVLLAALVGVSAGYRLRARRRETIPRSAEGPALAAGRTVAGLVLFGSVALAVVRPTWLEWSRLGLGSPSAVAGIGLALGGAGVAAAALAALGPNVSETVLTKRGHQLVTSGPYRWIRHPLYTGSLAFFAGLALLADSGLLLGATVASGALIRGVIVPREEAELEARFGERYLRYRRGTGALLPRWGR